MGSSKRQKRDRSSTAAYAASQPLFDALRNATDAVTTQQTALRNARDISQSLHAKIVNGDDERHAMYMDSAVKAWKSATDTYCAIFEQLVSITAAVPTEGRDAGKRHVEFEALLKTAKRARDVVEKYQPVEEAVSEDEDEEMKDAEPEHAEVKKEPIFDDEDTDGEPANVINSVGKRPMEETTNGEKPKSTASKSLLNAKIHHDKDGKVLWENGELKKPLESLTRDERKAWKIIVERGRRKERLARSRARKQQEKQDGPQGGDAEGKSGAKTEPVEVEAPTVEYEDITAQVDERIKAKEEKKQAEKAARKAERKRKRESGESFVEETAPEPPKASDPLAALEESLAEKPAKKKSKKSRSSDAAAEVEKAADPVIKPSVNGDETAKKVKKDKTEKVKKRKEVEVEDDTSKQHEETKKRKKAKSEDVRSSNPAAWK